MTRPSVTDETAQLPCGRTAAELTDLVADPDEAGAALVEHSGGCPYCQAELTELNRRWALVRGAADTPVPTPAGLVSRVLASVRELRPRLWAPGVELAQAGGTLRIAAPAVALLGRELFREFAAVRRGIALHTLAVDDDGLQVLVALRYRTPVVDTARELREWLRSGLAEHLGEAVPAIHVHVVDVLPA